MLVSPTAITQLCFISRNPFSLYFSTFIYHHPAIFRVSRTFSLQPIFGTHSNITSHVTHHSPSPIILNHQIFIDFHEDLASAIPEASPSYARTVALALLPQFYTIKYHKIPLHHRNPMNSHIFQGGFQGADVSWPKSRFDGQSAAAL